MIQNCFKHFVFVFYYCCMDLSPYYYGRRNWAVAAETNVRKKRMHPPLETLQASLGPTPQKAHPMVSKEDTICVPSSACTFMKGCAS